MMVFIHPLTLLNTPALFPRPPIGRHAAARRHGGFHEELALASRCAETWKRLQLAPQQLRGGQHADGEVGIGAGIPGMLLVQPRNDIK